MRFERTWTGNLGNAIHGLRHPYESYDKSDSYVVWDAIKGNFDFILGENDINLAQRMIKAGAPNDKFLRQIFVSVDITAPLFWWKEMDQYKVGTTTNSTSTMHKLASTPITLDCFETDKSNDDLQIDPPGGWYKVKDFKTNIIENLEMLRQKYIATKDKRYWYELIRWLPESWLQTRTWTANYEVLRNIIHWRTGHRLSEWEQFIQWCHTLPYAEELLFYNQNKNGE